MSAAPELTVDGLALRRATTAADAAAIQAILDADAETWLVLEGAPLVPDEGVLMLTIRPPEVPLERKHLFVADGVCVLDMLDGYPVAATWFLGLIFLAPGYRDGGIGTRVLEAIAAHARAHGSTVLRLGVVVENTAARRFYDRLGFRHVASKTRPTPSGGITPLDVLELAL